MMWGGGKRPWGRGLERSERGATTSARTAAPNPHVIQIDPKSAQRANPPTDRVVTPVVALTMVLNTAASSASLNVSRARLKAWRPFANRLTKYAPTRPSSVFPTLMPIDVAIDPAVVRFTKKALTRMAGHTR